VRVGITGHQNLSERCVELVRARIAKELTTIKPPLVGLSSLAAGADQLFAEAVIAAGGRLTVILPSQGYEDSFDDTLTLQRFNVLLRLAGETIRLPYDEPSEEAYWRAGQEIVNRCDLLLAVWDGHAAVGLGGTADVVGYARERGTTLRVVWPDGCARG
jgi:hypothetical protein